MYTKIKVCIYKERDLGFGPTIAANHNLEESLLKTEGDWFATLWKQLGTSGGKTLLLFA